MIDELQVRNYALIADANLEFSPGCTVLTGETGAGKTALMGALKLLIGERADSLLIRDGAAELAVSARLSGLVGAAGGGADEVDEDDAEGDVEGGAVGAAVGAAGVGDVVGAVGGAAGAEAVVSRRLSRQGRSRCTLNDELVTVSTLARRVGPGFELLGQHEHQSLLSPGAQLDYLDDYALASGLVQAGSGLGLAEAKAAYRAAFAAAGLAALALADLQQAAMTDARHLEEARFVLASIEAVDPVPGELEALEAELPILRASEDLALAVDAALAELRDDGAAIEHLALAIAQLEHVQNIDKRLDEACAKLGSLSIDLEDMATELRQYRELITFDPSALEAALDRVGALEGLRKRFGPRIEDVFAARAEALISLQRADNLPALIAAAEGRQASCEAALEEAALGLSSLRHQAAADLQAHLNASLAELAMPGAGIDFAFSMLARTAWTATGPARFELLYRASPKSLARPLARIASGGELSRLMLALKTEIGSPDGKTLVFDEVDAGVGGAAAQAVAGFLARLAARHQVIIVTHLAQIAVIADRHYVVEKSVQTAADSSGLAETNVRLISGQERVREIARMLSGEESAAALR
ncbi:MAG: AAA family ATPase, partial [Coriobacteriia bacterium]|nr:AAA family ATPase [Coriobacteriia bacterium]